MSTSQNLPIFQDRNWLWKGFLDGAGRRLFHRMALEAAHSLVTFSENSSGDVGTLQSEDRQNP